MEAQGLAASCFVFRARRLFLVEGFLAARLEPRVLRLGGTSLHDLQHPNDISSTDSYPSGVSVAGLTPPK